MNAALDRTKAPKGKPFHYIPLPQYETHYLNNGIPVYLLPFGNIDVVEVQAVFNAGSSLETKVGISDFTPRNMSEGTRNYTSLQFAQALDRYGSWLEYDAGHETISLNLISLTHLLPNTLPLMKEIIEEATFPESEFDKMKQRTLQKLEVNKKKSSFLAGKRFSKQLYGPAHPYGSTLDIEELQEIERADLVEYYRTYFQYSNMYLTACGQFDTKELLNQLNLSFGNQPINPIILPPSNAQKPFISAAPGRYHIELEGVQSSLRIGHKGLANQHADAFSMEFVNVILGGYFGSRLMHTIREEKGYTYGIYSVWRALRYGGAFIIQCDVGNEYVEPTIEAIKIEIKRLQKEPVKRNELSLVKKYKAGSSISERETPFQLNRLIRYAITNQISFEELDEKFTLFQNLDAPKIQQLANQYLSADNLIEVVCVQKT